MDKKAFKIACIFFALLFVLLGTAIIFCSMHIIAETDSYFFNQNSSVITSVEVSSYVLLALGLFDFLFGAFIFVASLSLYTNKNKQKEIEYDENNFCDACGTKIAPNTKFCPKCGNRQANN